MRKILIVILMIICGCGSEVNPKFDKGLILTDKYGNEYLVKRHVGENYSVVWIPRDKLKTEK